jgi:exosome complex RNA-binding protein Rrp4
MFLFIFTTGQNRANADWVKVGGKAIDIGIGKNGSVWMLGNSQVNEQGNNIYVRSGNSWKLVGGLHGVRIDVDPYGNPWVVTKTKAIYKRQNNKWVRIHGRASDIGIGANGAVWMLGNSLRNKYNDKSVYVWNGSNWGLIGGLFGVKIDVDPYGTTWVVSSDRSIARRPYNYWKKIPGKANDIGIGANGTVWILGNRGTGAFLKSRFN